jgi:Tol biopolymer transport system component
MLPFSGSKRKFVVKDNNDFMKTKILGSTVFSLGVILALAAVLPVATPSVLAKVPGANGLIAFVRSDSNNLDTTYIMNPDGTHLRLLLAGASVPHWSPDGTLLAMQTPFNGGCPPCSSTTIINPDTGQQRVLSPPDPNLATFCSLWSPDASHFACDGENDNDPSQNGIYTIRSSDGGGLSRITNAGGAIDIPIDYSPDGKQIVFGRVGPNHNCTTTSALYVVNVDGTGLHQITPGGFCDDDGSWSPDGTEIAFGHQGSLFVVHPDGTGLAKIPIATSGLNREADVTWSPDGTKIAFILFVQRGPGTSQEGIGTANADGSNVQLITSALPDRDHEADWGPHPLVP